MYTSFIGKKFLTAWNAREGKSLTAQQFFDEVMFPDFFDNNLHMLQVLNSKFVNPSVKGTNSEKRQMLQDQIVEAVSINRADGSFFVGYGAAEVTAGTSGQLTSMRMQVEVQEIYASWIGAALALGVEGGVCLLVSRDDLLWKIFEGWKAYREFLNTTPKIKGRQIETWNGQWIVHLSRGGDPKGCVPKTEENEDEKKGKYISIKTLGWTNVIFALCKQFPGEILTAYSYKLGKSNETIGFLNLHLHEVNRLYQFRDKVFFDKDESVLTYQEIEALEPYFNFKGAAEFGAIGLRTLEPNKLRNYLPQRDPKKNKDINHTKEDTRKQFQIFKLWIYAMLNKSELLELAGEIATLLRDFEGKTERGKSINHQLSKELRDASNLKAFLQKLSEILVLFPSVATTDLHGKIEQVVKMPSDQLPLFITLIRFEYAFQQAQSHN